MAPKNEHDPKKKAKQRRKYGMRAAFAAAAVALFGGGHHHYYNADDRFVEAMEEGRISAAKDYIDRVVTEETALDLYKRAIDREDMDMMSAIYNADDRYDTSLRDFLPVPDNMMPEVLKTHIEELTDYALENGKYEFLADMNNRFYGFDQSAIVMRLLREGETAQPAIDFIKYGGTPRLNDVYSIVVDALRADIDHDKLADFTVELRPQRYGTEVREIVNALTRNGELDFASVYLKKELEAGEFNVGALYVSHLAKAGVYDAMVQAAMDMNIDTDESLEGIAFDAFLAGHFDIAFDFIEHFDLDAEQFQNRVFTESVKQQNSAASAYILNKSYAENGGHDIAQFFTENDALFATSEGRQYMYDLALSTIDKLSPEAQDSIIGMFEGTMDDNLRRHINQSANDAVVTRPATSILQP